MTGDPRVDELRARIAALDSAIVRAVNDRLQVVGELRALKESLGLGFVDPEQERRIGERLAAENAGPLSDEGLRELVRELLALTKRELSRGG